LAKLVRDKIPEIVRRRGMRIKTHVAKDAEYWRSLKEKIFEEMQELSADGNPAELVDVLEIVKAMADFKGIGPAQLERLRKEKEKQSGGFKKRIISDSFGSDKAEGYTLATQRDVESAVRLREVYKTKHGNGRVVVIGGSDVFHGAPALASGAAQCVLAALRTGVGYATAFVPRDVLAQNRRLSPNIIVKPLGASNLGLSDFEMLSKEIGKADCLVIGNGISDSSQSLRATSKIISYAVRESKNVVADAGAIRALSEYPVKLGMNVVITPNEKEFMLLHNEELDPKNLRRRIDAALSVARKMGCIVLMKGHDTIVTDAERVKVVSSKSSVLAVMGTGDVLAGIIGGLASRSGDSFTAAVAGAYLHSKIGDALSKSMGNHILASDVIDCLPKAMKKFDRNY